MSLTALVFAAWNVGASRAAGANGERTSITVTLRPPAGVLTELIVNGASVLVIFNGIVIPFLIVMYVCVSSAPLNNQIVTRKPPLGHWRVSKYRRSPRRRSRLNVLGQGSSLFCI